MGRTARLVIGGVWLSGLGCVGVPPWLFDRERDITRSATGGGSATVACTGALTWGDEIPGATIEQLRALEGADYDLYARSTVRFASEGNEHLDLSPGRTSFRFDGTVPAHTRDWIQLSLLPDGTLRGSLGMYQEYEGDSGWMLEGQGPPVDLHAPGETTMPVRIVKNGFSKVGEGTCRVSWALDESVHHTWTEHYVPRRH